MPATRTLNPLHFEDLEPHRFEDLVRQLAYDLRTWHTLEATGRLGSDEGMDVRGIERVPVEDSVPPIAFIDEDQEETSRINYEERTWIIQCKRERSLTPARVATIVADCIPDGRTPPYGFVLAAATDFSLRSREVFRTELRSRGVQEFALWGKAELEDKLFEPRHDHLLFAYFGISLQSRRRSIRTQLGQRLATKRRLIKLLGDMGQPSAEAILLRDAAATDYPHPIDRKAFLKNPRWSYYRLYGHPRVDQLAFVVHEYWARANFETREWDRIEEWDQAYVRHPALADGPTWATFHGSEEEEQARRYWYTKVPDDERAMYRVLGFVHYDRIALVDEIGDQWHEPPHLLLDCLTPDQLFNDFADVVESRAERNFMVADQELRRPMFPETFPPISNEEFSAALERRV
jgi:hypothetical protein